MGEGGGDSEGGLCSVASAATSRRFCGVGHVLCATVLRHCGLWVIGPMVQQPTMLLPPRAGVRDTNSISAHQGRSGNVACQTRIRFLLLKGLLVLYDS